MTSKFIIKKDYTYHIGSSKRYSENQSSITTFCGLTIDADYPTYNIPLQLLKQTELCWDCQRKIEYYNYNKFPQSNEYDGDKLYIIRSAIKIGNNKGKIHIDTVKANNLEEAKNNVSNLYNPKNDIIYLRISIVKNGQINEIYNKRTDNN